MLLAILLLTYYAAVNIYGIVIMNMQKKEVSALKACREASEQVVTVSEKDVDSGIISDDVAIDADNNVVAPSNANNEKNGNKSENSKSKKTKPEVPIDCDELRKHRIKDSKVVVTAMLGGALGVYISMLAMKYRLKNMLFMVGMPVLIALNIYIMILAFRTWIIF